ncbi:MAG: YggS family pyridoxal phosphate enzyme [Deltaproteobacteria bacterium RBG_19FT_COMBO_43_11]|nr:MAG: YggS family pyridoxal phosphate enzyme [Deltaproteobacteria bacterium RBG_19FT_COMBO_43_11]
METDIAANIIKIRQQIAVAAARVGRDAHLIKLMAVTKTVLPEHISQAINAGITMFGENYVQEAKEKIAALGKQAQWHMIGHLQTNKAKYVVNLFDYVHSVDRIELAQELDKRARLAGHKMNILIEVNVSGEQTKNGVSANAALDLIKCIAPLENISVRGLMTMAPYSDNPENSRPYFSALRNLRNQISHEQIPEIQMEELSMGMTDDFEVAIEEGATIVRIGRAIFGTRN